MKLASSFGRYDDEWKEGDWNGKGEVPDIIMLLKVSHDILSGGKIVYRKT